MTNKARLLKEIEMVKRVLGTEKMHYQKEAEELSGLIRHYSDGVEREARQLSEDDVERLRKELANREKLLDSPNCDYVVSCECGTIRNILSRYARLRLASGRETI